MPEQFATESEASASNASGAENESSAGNTFCGLAASDIEKAWNQSLEFLLNERPANQPHWTGELSTSALSTATAVSALVMSKRSHFKSDDQTQHSDRDIDDAIHGGCKWIQEHQNADGGFGDTIRSHSNIATSLLCIAAWELAEHTSQVETQAQAAWSYVDGRGRWQGLRHRYGKDKTFVVPILANCALAGLVPWRQVPTLPFEAAWLPHSWYRFARMPVVSYAVPALVAIGQAKFHFVPPLNPISRVVRSLARKPTLKVLRAMQPASGGYLEAVPLTSFVLMSLAASGNGHLPVAKECERFILESRLADGSWPIDTNLATWVTSLTSVAYTKRCGELSVSNANQKSTAVKNKVQTKTAQTSAKQPSATDSSLDEVFSAGTLRWLLSCQHTTKHPFTGANPGGWGWTDLSGAVPDADDTPSALLALSKVRFDSPALSRLEHQTLLATGQGIRWLWKLQNRDGGWPTFCRGWGKLPFDRSGTDLTAHAIRAFRAWAPRLGEIETVFPDVPTYEQLAHAELIGFRYLRRNQRPDGSWLPLWFGNQDDPVEDNPFYGTGRVLLAYADSGKQETEECLSALNFLRNSQNADGGWGGGISTEYRNLKDNSDFSREIGSTIEETAVVLEALIQCGGDPLGDATIMRGLKWLSEIIDQGHLQCAWPIGFYFAKLWYFERLYPAIFSLGALGSALRRIASHETELVR